MIQPRANKMLESQLALSQQYEQIRAATESLCRPLAVEDYVVQSMPDVSPTRWHLAHTSWFFENFVLAKADTLYRSPHPLFHELFNSYYVQAGQRWPRPKRGLLTRPSVREIYDYRRQVDQHVLALLQTQSLAPDLLGTLELGLHHEQQHQELILTDIKHVLSLNPMGVIYQEKPHPHVESAPLHWLKYEGGVKEIGHDGTGFHFDHEGPRHRALIHPFSLASRLTTCGEYLQFMQDGGYTRAPLWLSDGWQLCEAQQWRAPLYWFENEGQWWQYTLTGVRPVRDDEPICHVSYYEADAFARWCEARLPTEFEWELASHDAAPGGHFVEQGLFHPTAISSGAQISGRPMQMFGDAWEWTQSPFTAYPGYRASRDALGEYNGKFMCNQFVLRGGSCATPQSHIRRTYRNFFPPSAQWQFSSIRLARDLS